MRLENKVALVSGAGTGIGQSICCAYAEEGADVAIVYSSSRTGAEKTLAEVEKRGRRGAIMQVDLSRPEQIEKLVKDVYGIFGRIDIVVNNGAARDPALFLESPFEEWKHCIDTNLRGNILMIKNVAPIMKRQGRGKIINIASVMGYRPAMLERIGYQSSKSGIVALTRAAAVELGPYGIYVNALAPGTINTFPGGAKFPDREMDEKERAMIEKLLELDNGIPLRRRGLSDDMLGPAIFLASDESDYVDGICIIADGGWSSGD